MKTWSAGAILPAAELNTYLRDNGNELRTGGIAIASQAAQDFIHASSSSQLGRVAAVALKSPRYSGSAWQMKYPGLVQVISATNATAASTASTTYGDTGLTANITPISTSSNVLVIVSQAGVVSYDVGGAAASSVGMDLQLLRGATSLIAFVVAGANSTGNTTFARTAATVYLDSPATTSATTYKTQYRCSPGAVANDRASVQTGNIASSIALVEVLFD